MSESSHTEPQFGRWRTALWPVHAHELKKLVPMLVIFFLLFFSYNVLRVLKDALVVTAKSSGAEVIPFIKTWMMFPGAILMTLLYTRLANSFKRETVFYIMLGIFMSYFFIFGFVLYPLRDVLHPNELADRLQLMLPKGLWGAVAMFRNWTFTTFYVMAELWGAIIVFVLFWGFANQVTRVDEAKRFYGLFGIGGNFSGVMAGTLSAYISQTLFNPSLPFGNDAWEQSLMLLILIVTAASFAALLLFRWVNTKVLTDERFYDAAMARKHDNVKGKLSLRDSFSYLFRSKYMISIAVIVISYNLVINLVEVVWKHQVRELYPNPAEFNLYMNNVTTVVGIVATLTALFVSGNAIRKFGWTFTAMLTPAILFLTSIGFFGFFFLKGGDFSGVVEAYFGVSPLALVVFFGSMQNVFSRSAKYSVFDATKEMAFVPLSAECQLKGKPAIDGVCSRLGKSGGSVIHQTFLLMFATISASAPYVAVCLLVIISVWFVAVKLLGKRFNEAIAEASKPAGSELRGADEASMASSPVGEKLLQESTAV